MHGPTAIPPVATQAATAITTATAAISHPKILLIKLERAALSIFSSDSLIFFMRSSCALPSESF